MGKKRSKSKSTQAKKDNKEIITTTKSEVKVDEIKDDKAKSSDEVGNVTSKYESTPIDRKDGTGSETKSDINMDEVAKDEPKKDEFKKLEIPESQMKEAEVRSKSYPRMNPKNTRNKYSDRAPPANLLMQPGNLPAPPDAVDIRHLPIFPLRGVICVSRFLSEWKPAQSKLGRFVGVIPSRELQIDKFNDWITYQDANLKLINAIYERWKGIVINVKSESTNYWFPNAQPTMFELIGFNIYDKVFGPSGMLSWFKDPQILIQLRGSLQARTNDYLDNFKTIESVVSGMSPSERLLKERLDALEYQYHVIDIPTYDKYLQMFNDWNCYLTWQDQRHKGKYRPGFAYYGNVEVNYNHQMLGDQYMLYKNWAYDLMVAAYTEYVDLSEMLNDKGTLVMQLSQALNARALVANEVNLIPAQIGNVLDKHTFIKLMAVISMSRWVRMTFSEYRSQRKSALLLWDLVLIGALLKRINVYDDFRRWREIFLIIHLFSWFNPNNRSDPASIDWSYWETGPGSLDPNPINTYLLSHNLNSPASTVDIHTPIFNYFATDNKGKGWAGAGMNPPLYQPTPPTAARFSINAYEPVFGIGWVPNSQPFLPVQWENLFQLGRALGQYRSRNIPFIRSTVQPIMQMIEHLTKIDQNIRYMCQYIEMLNYYMTFTYLAAPAYDDMDPTTGHLPSIRQVNYNYRDFNTLNTWQDIINAVSKANLAEPVEIPFILGSLTGMVMAYDFTNIGYQGAPPYSVIQCGLSLNETYREMARFNFVVRAFLDRKSFIYSQMRKRAVSMCPKNEVTDMVWDMMDSSKTGYGCVDGIQFYIDVYSAVNDYLNTDDNCIAYGFLRNFVYGVNLGTYQIPIGTRGLFYANYSLQANPNNNNAITITQLDLQTQGIDNNVQQKIQMARNGYTVLVDVPIKFSFDGFECSKDADGAEVLEGRYMPDIEQQSILDFNATSTPYTVNEYKYNYWFEDDNAIKRYQVVIPGKSFSVYDFPWRRLDVDGLAGFIDNYTARSKLTFSYEPLVYRRTQLT